MLIMTSSQSIKVGEVLGPLYDSSGNEVDTGLYTITNGTEHTATVIDVFKFSCTDSFDEADNILIGATSDTLAQNSIIEVGDNTYRVAKSIKHDIHSTIIVKDNFVTFTTVNLPEGLYYFQNNVALVISRTFSNTRVTYTDVLARYDELKDTEDIEAKNNEAIKSVIADFSYKSDFFRSLDLLQIRELVMLKILTFVTKGTSAYEDAKDNYNEYKKDMISIIKVEADGTISNPDVIDDSTSDGTFRWFPTANPRRY